MHCKWSPSGLYRSLKCPASLQYGSGRSSEAAQRGTQIHSLAHQIIRDPGILDIIDLGLLATMHGVTLEDAEVLMRTYIDYVTNTLPVWASTVRSEQVVGATFGNDLIYGTADCVAYAPYVSLEVVDLKCGKGMFVETDDNPQLMAYAYAAMETFKLYAHAVRVTVIQPYWDRTDAPVIRTVEYQADQLEEWHKETSETVANADMTVHVPGDHCQFCEGLKSHRCPAHKHTGRAIAEYDFDNVDWQSIEYFLDNGALILKNIKEVKSLARTYLGAGGTLGNYVLAPSYGYRSWSVSDRTVVRRLKKGGLKNEDIWTKTLVSPAQAEKKGMPKSAVNDITESPCTGDKLVKSKTKPQPKLTEGLDALIGVTNE